MVHVSFDNIPYSLALWIGGIEKGVLWFSGNRGLGEIFLVHKYIKVLNYD